MNKSKDNSNLVGFLFLSAICGGLFLLQLAYNGCENAKLYFNQRHQTALAEKLRQKESLFSPEERARLTIARERQFQQLQRQQMLSEKDAAEFERAVEIINAHGYDVKPAE